MAELKNLPELTITIDRPIVLVGLMGAGKTTVGRRLAKAIDREFLDSDVEIEEAAACSIADIFAIHGEPIFRDLEKRVIHRLLERPELVLATGGGAWMQDPIRKDIKDSALSIWLHADLDVLVERVEKRDHRPLLEAGDKRDILRQLIDQRYPIYEQADIRIDTSDDSHEHVVADIINALNAYGTVTHAAS